jgi:hypothetical protein
MVPLRSKVAVRVLYSGVRSQHQAVVERECFDGQLLVAM